MLERSVYIVYFTSDALHYLSPLYSHQSSFPYIYKLRSHSQSFSFLHSPQTQHYSLNNTVSLSSVVLFSLYIYSPLLTSLVFCRLFISHHGNRSFPSMFFRFLLLLTDAIVHDPHKLTTRNHPRVIALLTNQYVVRLYYNVVWNAVGYIYQKLVIGNISNLIRNKSYSFLYFNYY